MPIEIRELVIRANVDTIVTASQNIMSESDKIRFKQEIMDACLDKVEKLLERKEKR